MIKIRVHISEEDAPLEPFVVIKLPALPRIGDSLSLEEETRLLLEHRASKNVEIADIHKEWISSRPGNDYSHVKEEELKDICFIGAHVVTKVWFESDKDYVHVNLWRTKGM